MAWRRRLCSVGPPIAHRPRRSARPQRDKGYDRAFRLRWSRPLPARIREQNCADKTALPNDILIVASKSTARTMLKHIQIPGEGLNTYPAPRRIRPWRLADDTARTWRC